MRDLWQYISKYMLYWYWGIDITSVKQLSDWKSTRTKLQQNQQNENHMQNSWATLYPINRNSVLLYLR